MYLYCKRPDLSRDHSKGELFFAGFEENMCFSVITTSKQCCFTREENDRYNQNRERFFFTWEKNDRSDQIPQRSMSFAPSFPHYVRYLQLPCFAVIQRGNFLSP